MRKHQKPVTKQSFSKDRRIIGGFLVVYSLLFEKKLTKLKQSRSTLLILHTMCAKIELT